MYQRRCTFGVACCCRTLVIKIRFSKNSTNNNVNKCYNPYFLDCAIHKRKFQCFLSIFSFSCKKNILRSYNMYIPRTIIFLVNLDKRQTMKVACNSISECFLHHVFGTWIAFMRLTHLKSDRYTHLLPTSVGNDSSLARC